MKLQYHAQIRTSNGIRIVSNELRMFKKIEFNIPRGNEPKLHVSDNELCSPASDNYNMYTL